MRIRPCFRPTSYRSSTILDNGLRSVALICEPPLASPALTISPREDWRPRRESNSHLRFTKPGLAQILVQSPILRRPSFVDEFRNARLTHLGGHGSPLASAFGSEPAPARGNGRRLR